MKKIIGILGVAVIAATMFFNGNIDSKSDLSLESLIGLNNANAETVFPNAIARVEWVEINTAYCYHETGGGVYPCSGDSPNYAYTEYYYGPAVVCGYHPMSACTPSY